MKGHIIEISNNQRKIKLDQTTKKAMISCIEACLDEQGFESPAEVSVTLVSNEKIREYNRDFLGKDAVTDVLSFPIIHYDKEGKIIILEGDVDFDRGERLILGDIVISLEKAQEQALEYNHSFLREVCYLTVHSMYHLFGYDHMTEDQKKRMREKEEKVLEVLQIFR